MFEKQLLETLNNATDQLTAQQLATRMGLTEHHHRRTIANLCSLFARAGVINKTTATRGVKYWTK